MSEEERILWVLLRNRRFAAFKFRRQVPLGNFFADFVCFDAKLVVELDGSRHAAHEQAAFDARRDTYFRSAGFRVLRITTADFFREREFAMDTIWNALHDKM
jgi:very-short-patch-repair endonuclease